MHRDEAIYARADAHAITLTPEEAGIALDVLRAHLGMQGGRLSDLSFPGKVQRLADRLEAAPTTLPS